MPVGTVNPTRIPGVQARVAEAVALLRAGKHAEVEHLCQFVLAGSPDNVDARNLLAEVYGLRGRYSEAAEQLTRVAQLQPRDAAVLRRLGDAQFAAADAAGAVESFRRAIALEPMRARAHNNLGRALARLGESDAAVEAYRRALSLDPDYAIAFCNLGMALADREELNEALSCYERAIALNPKLAQAHTNYANALQRLGRTNEALVVHEHAVSLEPYNVTALCNHGTTLLSAKRVNEALARYEVAARLKPDCVDAVLGQANALRLLRRNESALAHYDRALTLEPDDITALGNRITLLMDLERFDEAIEACDRLLALKPDYPAALLYRGLSLNFMGRLRYEEAAKTFARLLEKEPDQPYVLGYLLHAYAMCSDWGHDELNAEALRQAAAGKAVSSPFAFLGITDDARIQLENARRCVQLTHPAAPTPLWNGQQWRNDKIRVAYISNDLREHAVSYLLVGVFEKHDRKRFEVYGISFRPPAGGEFALRAASALDLFIDASTQSDEEIAQLLQRMQVDIVVDLMGFTRGHRIDLFARRPAPVAVSYLGFPGTMGAPYIDYILADDYLIPAHLREHYSEHIAYLPDCFQANDDRREIAPPPSRAELGLPQDSFVLCSFNNGYKVGPRMFDVWCRLLNANPQCVLWLLGESDLARSNLLREANARGVESERLVFADRRTYAEHLARMSAADLFLDTLPFNAGTTASDALWAGLPVLTCSGEAFASRMAGSLLQAVGLPELITDTLEDYERLASRLITDRAALAGLRARLAANRLTSPLFATERFCRNLEAAYEVMHERTQCGEPPATFHVRDPRELVVE